MVPEGYTVRSRGRKARSLAMCACFGILWGLLQFPLHGQEGPYDNTFLDGLHQAHDLFAIADGTGQFGSGTRSFDGAGRLVSLVSVAGRSPLDYAVDDQGRFGLSAPGFNPGQVGALWYAGGLAVYAPQLAPDADEQLPKGYGALRLSAALGSGYRNADFAGNYSYHGLLYSEAGWWNAFGAAEVNGSGGLLQFRSGAAPWNLSYRVESSGGVALGNDGTGLATLLDDGDVIVQTVRADLNENPFFPQRHNGLGFYIRRGSSTAPVTLSQFSGIYQVLSLSVSAGGTGLTRVGTVVAGGPGVFEGDLGGQSYGGRIVPFVSGVFRIEGDNDRIGTLGSNGDIAVLTRENAQVGQAASLELWLRTAGGRPLPGDSDGDGVRDAVELSRGLNPGNRDSDNDGWIDSADPRPNTADNIYTAQITPSQLEVVDGATAILEATLQLDSGIFPYFDWTLSSSATWLTATATEGRGDGEIVLRIDPRNLSAENSPYTARIAIDAPFMKEVEGPTIQVEVRSNQIQIVPDPPALALTVVEGATLPVTGSLAIESPDAPSFSWRAEGLAPWMSVSPAEGSGAADLAISVDPQQLLAAQSPVESAVRIDSPGVGANTIEIPVTVTVLPPRSLGEVFLPAPGDAAQSAPAIALDSANERYLLAWQEGGQVFATVFDREGTPVFGRQRMSQTAEGEAFRPAVAIDPVSRLGYVIWEQVFQVGDDARSQLQYRTIHMDSLALRPFPTGLPTSGGFLTRPKVTYHEMRDEMAVLYLQTVDEGTRPRLLRLNPADGARLADVALLADENLPQAMEGLAICGERGGNAYGLSWLEGRIGGVGFAAERARFLSWDSASGSATRTELFDGATGTASGVVAGSQAGEWAVVFEGTERQVQALLLRPDGDSDRVATFESRGAGLGMGVAYALEAEQFLVHWSANPASVERRSTWQYLTLGANPIKPETFATRFTAASAGMSSVYNPFRNEFVVTWAGSSGIAVLRLDGGSIDEDQDGLPNDWEFRYDLDPLDATGDNGAAGDPDLDGLSNIEELVMGTSPVLADTDGDGLLDSQEDRNRDGRLDRNETSPLLADTDGDGANDYAEWFLGANGNDPTDVPGTGILRAIYDDPQPGAVVALSLDVYIAAEGEYRLHLNSPETPGWNAPPGWESEAPASHFGQVLEQGVHRLPMSLTAPEGSDVRTLVGRFDFRIEGPSLSRSLVLELVVDPLVSPQFERIAAESLVSRFAPVFRGHRDAFLPLVAVEEVWQRARLYTQPQQAIPPAPGAFDLQQSAQVEAYLDLPGDDLEALISAFPEALSPSVYYTVARLDGPSLAPEAPANHTVIQYYLYFPGNGWGRERMSGHRHEGHWQLAQVLLDEALQPYRLSLSQQWRVGDFRSMTPALSVPWETVEKAEETHPVVFLARGSHSLHPGPGSTRQDVALDEHDGLGGWYFPEDQAALIADYPDTRAYQLSALGRLGESEAPLWLRFAGRWGQHDYPADARDLSNAELRNGPRGPVFMEALLSEEDHVVRPWLDPWAWATWAHTLSDIPQATVTAVMPEELYGLTAVLLDGRGRIFRTPIDSNSGMLRFEVPQQHYTLQVVETNALGQETWRASARFDTGFGESLLFPTLPPDAITDLGLLRLEGDRLLDAAIYEISDADGHGIPDFQDSDADNDGQANGEDDDMLGDGFEDTFQIQASDEPGVPRYYGPVVEDGGLPADFDGDGFIDVIDLDWDNDGYTNAAEIAAATNPRNFFDSPDWRAGDLDGDGIRHIAEAQRMVNMALLREDYNARADFDANGRVDAVDIHAMLRAMLVAAP